MITDELSGIANLTIDHWSAVNASDLRGFKKILLVGL